MDGVSSDRNILQILGDLNKLTLRSHIKISKLTYLNIYVSDLKECEI